MQEVTLDLLPDFLHILLKVSAKYDYNCTVIIDKNQPLESKFTRVKIKYYDLGALITHLLIINYNQNN